MHHDILDAMMENHHFKYEQFCSPNKKIENELANGYLNGNDICLNCKRYVCKIRGGGNNGSKESDLECFLRHIRNAIAHGRVYYCHAGNKIHIVFEDENESKNLSARIVCVKADLEHWKKSCLTKSTLRINEAYSASGVVQRLRKPPRIEGW